MDHKERIRQMAVEAKEWALSQIPAQGPEAFQSLRDEYFAQAVARECSQIAMETEEEGAPDDGCRTKAYNTAAAIEARFGLEG